MNKYKIASVISYSSYHNAYIERCIEEAKKVSDVVVVVSSRYFFDGTLDTELKEELVTDWIGFRPNEEPARFWHNLSRRTGYMNHGGVAYDFVFFIDSDEVLEGDKVKLWLDEVVEPDQDYKLAHFWYYRDTCYRARTPEEGAVLVSRETLESLDMEWFGARERENFSKKWHYMASYQNKVLGHHYSWAGTKEMMLRKVSSWGHNQDKVDWKKIVENEYSHEFKYTCPFKPYRFDKIEPYIGFTFNK